MRKFVLRILCFFILLVCINPVLAINGNIFINRSILALYDSTETKSAELTLIHAHAEVILNHLGYILTYYDINKGLPDEDYMNGFH
ncbi:hypothetical protein J7L67_05190, partial [bacterium]|nr:hypothetical protein [bacterium]